MNQASEADYTVFVKNIIMYVFTARYLDGQLTLNTCTIFNVLCLCWDTANRRGQLHALFHAHNDSTLVQFISQLIYARCYF